MGLSLTLGKSDPTLASQATSKQTLWPNWQLLPLPGFTSTTPQEKDHTPTIAGPPFNPTPSPMAPPSPGDLPPTSAGILRRTSLSHSTPPRSTSQGFMPPCGLKPSPRSYPLPVITFGHHSLYPGPSKCRYTGPDGGGYGTESLPTDGRSPMPLIPTHPPMTTAPSAAGTKTGLAISLLAVAHSKPTTSPATTLLSKPSGRASAVGY